MYDPDVLLDRFQLTRRAVAEGRHSMICKRRLKLFDKLFAVCTYMYDC